MNNSILVSVIVPAYNSEKTIQRCMESILSQTYKNIELVIIDDCSKDDTENVIKKQSDARIRYFKNVYNSGVSESRNMGIKKSRGDYVMFVDADDTLRPNAVEKMLSIIREKNIEIVKCCITKIYKNTEVTEQNYELSDRALSFNRKEDRRLLLSIFFEDNATLQCTVPSLMISKEFLDNKGVLFEPQLIMMEDVVFYAELFSRGGRIYFFNEPLYNYYQNAESATHSASNCKNIIEGITITNARLHEILGKNPNIDLKHICILAHYISENYYHYKKLYIPDKVKYIALNARNAKTTIKQRIIIYSILNNRSNLIRIKAKIRHIKQRIGKKEVL